MNVSAVEKWHQHEDKTQDLMLEYNRIISLLQILRTKELEILGLRGELADVVKTLQEQGVQTLPIA